MPSRANANTELTPQAKDVLKDIIAETKTLRDIDLVNTPPATVFEADR